MYPLYRRQKQCRITAGTLILAIALFLSQQAVFAQNPIIRDQFSADPTARVFNDRVYIYPSHDILAKPGQGRPNWFCMEDYHVFSSDNLTDWTDHGMIVTQNAVPWVKPDSYSMWAPDCIYRNGKYYFYFPSTPKDTMINGRGFTVGVAVSDKPEGPFIPQAGPVIGVKGIDPNVFIDDDGQAYLYWSQGSIFGAKLKDNMVELDAEVKKLSDFPTKGLIEGPFLFKRNGIYYMTYPHVENKTERLEYATSESPLGPFRFAGVIMDESPNGCWTNHQSLVQFRNQWYLFYHHNDYSPSFDKARSVRADSLSFNDDGTIRKVIPTLRGIGVTKATDKIQLDRYSAISPVGASISYLDSTQKFNGWKTVLDRPGAWIQYNSVQLDGKLKTVVVRARSSTGAVLRLKPAGKTEVAFAEIKITSGEWKEQRTKLSGTAAGLINLVAELSGNGGMEIDWIRFE
ncbi:MAG: alpha-N-arabinofuranosidase [Chitinophagaceae bacterium]|nr:MAG: alpha-N-arabinofuranosidase [Chitinophagaceae bacterium]